MASVQHKVGKNGKKTYYVVVSIRGKHRWIKAGTQQAAKSLKKDIESLHDSERMEKLGVASREKRIDDFFKGYTDYVRLRTSPNTLKRYRTVLNTFITFLTIFHPRVRLLSQIKSELMEDYQSKRLESCDLKRASDGEKNGNHKNIRLPMPQTVNYEISVLRSAFIWAHEREWIASVPTRKVKKLRVNPKREARILTPKECKHFLKTARQLAREDKRMKIFSKAFAFLLNTGLRSGELCNLTWDDVNLETGLIKIRPKPGWTPKSYSREFYLNEAAKKVLMSIREVDGLVFRSYTDSQLDGDDLRRGLLKVSKECGLNGFTRVHDLRHTFSSLMQMNGVDPGTVAAILGHRDIDTTRIYTHQTPEHLKKSVNKIRVG